MDKPYTGSLKRVKPIPVRLDEELLKQVEYLAKELKLPVSTTIRFFLNEIVKQKIKEKRK